VSRTKKDSQSWFCFRDSNLSITRQYFEKYEAISAILDGVPRLLDLVHRDLDVLLTSEGAKGPAPRFTTVRIPADVGHRIRSKAITHSGPRRSPIPVKPITHSGQGDHRFR
jgi:hypothetical protein